jgi:hypothetical protein
VIAQLVANFRAWRRDRRDAARRRRRDALLIAAHVARTTPEYDTFS